MRITLTAQPESITKDDFRDAVLLVKHVMPTLSLMNNLQTLYAPHIPDAVLLALRAAAAVDSETHYETLLPNLRTVVVQYSSIGNRLFELLSSWQIIVAQVQRVIFRHGQTNDFVNCESFESEAKRTFRCLFPKAVVTNCRNDFCPSFTNGDEYMYQTETCVNYVLQLHESPNAEYGSVVIEWRATDGFWLHENAEFFQRNFDATWQRFAADENSNERRAATTGRKTRTIIAISYWERCSWYTAQKLLKPWQWPSATKRSLLCTGHYACVPPHVLFEKHWNDEARKIIADPRSDVSNVLMAEAFMNAVYDVSDFGCQSYDYTALSPEVEFSLFYLYDMFYSMLADAIENRLRRDGTDGHKSTLADGFYSNLAYIEWTFLTDDDKYWDNLQNAAGWSDEYVEGQKLKKRRQLEAECKRAVSKLIAVCLGIDPPYLPSINVFCARYDASVNNCLRNLAERQSLYVVHCRLTELIKKLESVYGCACILPKLKLLAISVS